MHIIGAYEAKTHLPELLRRVEQGEKIMIARHGLPIAILSPVGTQADADIQETISALKTLRSHHQRGDMTVTEMKNQDRR